MIKADQYPAGYVDMIGEGLHDALKKGITTADFKVNLHSSF